MEKYDPSAIEPKWQEYWKEKKTYKDYSRKEKFYVLDMFPYPSGVGLHVGHPKGYIATDVVARMKYLQGSSVLHPMGWDAFGLPAENYAIKNKVHPKVAVEKNVATFKRQLEKFGFTHDWDREINTTDPEYYRWTQWIFLKLFEKGLAYESDEPVNWCPSCKTVLANEDLEKGLCERCGSQVEQKRMRQWVLRMTDYADRLLADLDNSDLDWEESIITQQKNWIGRSEGVQFGMAIKGTDEKIEVYTTRIDTVFGMTYAVVAPEHPIIGKLKDLIGNYAEVEKYAAAARNKTAMERTELQKEKTGVRLEGLEAVNPFNGEAVPLFAADYVIGGYGTGAVMAVPAHDERDFEFAKKYDLPVIQVIKPEFGTSHQNEEYRNGGCAIVFNAESQRYAVYLTPDGLMGFFSGGVGKEEDMVGGILREVTEESGLFDFAEVEKIGVAVAHYYHQTKGVYRIADPTCILVRLASDRVTDPKREAHENFELHWATPEEILENWKKHDAMNGRGHWVWFLNKAVGRAISLGWDISNDRNLFKEESYVDDGILVNSGNEYDGLSSAEAREKMADWLEKEGIGARKVNYKMRDWVFSRQRYWGEPIPIIHCEKCGTVPVPESELPVRLPEVEKYEPTGTGEGPLAAISDWVNVRCPKCGGPAKRETNTMPQWAGSCWYYLRYIDPNNKEALISKELEKKWMPVDLYVGGAEHATRHLLYARFWHKFLHDIGVVSTTEPFKKLVHVGLIAAEDGRKMSKRWGNVVNPDDVIAQFGADAMRLYEMFMGPFTQGVSWSTKGVNGMRRFLEKAWRIGGKVSGSGSADEQIRPLVHKTIKKVGEDIENFRFNTAVSQMMVLANAMDQEERIAKEHFESLLKVLSPFAPHIAEELWNRLGNEESIFLSSWPEYDPELAKDEEIEMVVQVNGKVRDRIRISAETDEEEMKKLALESDKVKAHIEGKEIRKIVAVKGKLVSIAV